jgi:dsDNA-specific endonuclease/ATPase MutS2
MRLIPQGYKGKYMSNIIEYESISTKIKGLERELDTFIQVVHEIKEIRGAVGTLPDDLEKKKAEIEERKKEFETLISSANDQMVNLEQRARNILSNLEIKNDIMTEEAGSRISDLIGNMENSIQERTKELNKTGNIEKKINIRIKRVEERFLKVLTRQQYIIVTMSALFIAGMSFFAYLFFMQ